MHPRWVFWPTIRSVGATKNPQVQQVQPGFPPGRAFATGDLQPPVARRWFDDDHFLSLLMLANMGVSENRGTPKWMVYNRKPYSNGRFGGKTHYFRSAIQKTFQEFHGMDFFFVKKISSFGPFFLKTHSHAQACTSMRFSVIFGPRSPIWWSCVAGSKAMDHHHGHDMDHNMDLRGFGWNIVVLLDFD